MLLCGPLSRYCRFRVVLWWWLRPRTRRLYYSSDLDITTCQKCTEEMRTSAYIDKVSWGEDAKRREDLEVPRKMREDVLVPPSRRQPRDKAGQSGSNGLIKRRSSPPADWPLGPIGYLLADVSSAKILPFGCRAVPRSPRGVPINLFSLQVARTPRKISERNVMQLYLLPPGDTSSK